MHTNDEVTRHFFKNSSVQVLLCPRSAGKGHSWVKKQVRDKHTVYAYIPLLKFLCLKASMDVHFFSKVFIQLRLPHTADS